MQQPTTVLDPEREAEIARRIDGWLAHMTWRPDFARWRAGRIWQEQRQAERLRLIAHYGGALERRRILDLGSGMGGTSVALALAGAAPLAFEYNRAYCDIIRLRAARYDLALPVVNGAGEALPFADGSFDLVYSWGVLHHTPRPDAAIAEIARVLAPTGEARVMLYSRRSWVAYGLWLRHALAAGRPFRTLTDVVATHMESPGTKAFTRGELRELFAGFGHVRLNGFVTPYDRRVAGPLARLTGPALGWFVGVRATRQ